MSEQREYRFYTANDVKRLEAAMRFWRSLAHALGGLIAGTLVGALIGRVS